MKKHKIVAITGGIGSGKSFALAILKREGYHTLSCDQIVNELYQKPKVKKLIKKMFPSGVSGRFRLVLDKKEIARLTFNDKDKHAQLTSTITPLVLEQIKKRTKKLEGLVFVEVPLLFECNYQNEFDQVLVIMRDKKARINSVINRSNLTEQQVIDRMNRQVDYDKLDLSNYITVNNDGDVNNFEQLILDQAKSLQNR